MVGDAGRQMPHLYFEASAVVIATVLLGKYGKPRQAPDQRGDPGAGSLASDRATRVIDGRETSPSPRCARTTRCWSSPASVSRWTAK